MFNNLQKLQDLDLSRNNLTHLSQNTFSGLTHLIRLDLSRNNLIQIDSAFRELDELQVLNLRDNFLLNISQNTFSNLTNLVHLNLHSNALKEIDESSAFVSLLRLERLDISHNCLNQSFGRLTVFSQRLRELDLSDMCLNHPPDSMTSSVTRLRLTKNKINKISDGDLDSFPHLIFLDLNSNKLNQIEEDSLGRLSNLDSLLLSSNNLRNVPTSLPVNLSTLKLDFNRINSIFNDTFTKFLTDLNLANNIITVFSTCAFCHLKRLEKLDVSSNKIRVINRDLFADLNSLNVLLLSNNPIVLIERYSLISLTRCRHLDLSSLHDLLDIDVNILDPLISLQTLNASSSPRLLNAMLNSSRMTDIVATMTTLDVSRNNLMTVTEQAVRKIHDGVKHLIRSHTQLVCRGIHVSTQFSFCDSSSYEVTDTSVLSDVSTEVKDLKRGMNSEAILAQPLRRSTDDDVTVRPYSPLSMLMLVIVATVVALLVFSVIYVVRTPLMNVLYNRRRCATKKNRRLNVGSGHGTDSFEDSLSVISLREYDIDDEDCLDDDDLSEITRRKRRITLMDSWSESRHTHRLLANTSTPNDLFVDLT